MMQKRTGSLSMIASTNAQEVVNNHQVDEVHGSRCLVPGSLPWYLVLNPERCQTGIKWCQEIEVLTVCLARHARLLMVPGTRYDGPHVP